ITGFVFTVVYPDLLDTGPDAVTDALGSRDIAARDTILNLVNTALSQYWAIGIVGLVTGLYAGPKSMGHLRNAVRTQWRSGFDLRPQKINIVVWWLGNLLLLLGLLLGLAVT